MPLQIAMALLGFPQVRGALSRTFGGLFRGLGAGGRGAPTPEFRTPAQFGGRGSVGPGGGFFGHSLTFDQPTFNLPGRGGGSAFIPELARAASGGGAFARGAIGQQAASAERFKDIDALIELMREQAREGGMSDPLAGLSPGGVGGLGFY